MDIIDAFVVTLGLDPRDYQREIKKYRDDRKRLSEEDAKYNRQSEDAQKRMVDGIRSLRNETAGFLFMLTGASSLKDFAANILTGDAATGRLARNLGLATEQVSAWEGAIKRVGGSSGDIDNALRAMSSAFQALQLTGMTGHDADFQGLGVTAKDLQNPQDALLKIAEASQRMGRPEFNARLSRIGFDQNTINLLAKGRVEVSRMLEEQRKLGVATDADAEAAQRFHDRLSILETAITAKVRPALERIVGIVGDWLMKGDNLNTSLTVAEGLLVAIAIAVAAAYWPFALLAGAIGLVATNLDKIKTAWNGLPKGFRDFVENLGNMVQGNDYKNAWDYLGDAVGGEIGASIKRWGGSQGKGSKADDPTAGVEGAVSGFAGEGAIRSGAGSSARAEQFFRANGYTAAQARGIVAAMKAENRSLDPSAFNSAGGGQGAYGLGQWRGARLRALRAKFGPNPTFDQQLQFMLEEMRGTERAAGSAIQSADSSSAAARAMIDRFYRPGVGASGDYARAGRHLGQPIAPGARVVAAGTVTGGSTTQTTSVGQIVIYSAATDADGLAHDMRGALAKRGLVVQANTGLQP